MNLGNIGMQPCRDLNEPVEGLAKSYGVQEHKRGKKMRLLLCEFTCDCLCLNNGALHVKI